MPSASKALPGGRTRPWEAYTVPRAHVAFSGVGKGLRTSGLHFGDFPKNLSLSTAEGKNFH